MYTALNISSRNVKVLTLNGKQVKNWANLDIASGLVRDGTILKPQEVGEVINSLFKTSGASRKNVIVSIASMPFTYRFISLPRLESSLMEEAILRMVKKEITLPIDELYIAWEPTVSKGSEQEYFVAGVPRNTVDTLLQTLEIAKVEPYLVELRSLALARAANRSDAIVVNMEPGCFDIAVITNGLPSVLHTLSPKGDDATLEDNITRLANELTKITAFSQSSEPNTQINPSTPLLLTGELAAGVMESGLLQSQVEYPIEPLVPPVASPNDLPIAEYTCSIGLAIKKTKIKSSTEVGAAPFHDIDVNILAGKYRQPKAKPIPMKGLIPAIALVVAIGLLFPLLLARTQVTNENQTLETELTQISRHYNLAKAMSEEAIKTEATISEISALAAALKAANGSILDTGGGYLTGLQQVLANLPSTAYFTSITVSKDTIVIQGEADNIFTVMQYATTLEALGIYKEVRVTYMKEDVVTAPETGGGESSPDEVTVITFEIVCTR
jgi:Tfp pilus assembly protein PilN